MNVVLCNFSFQWYEEWKRNLPEIELPEWAKFNENPFLKISAKYDDLRAKWAERDLAHLTEWKNKLSNFEIQWKTRDDTDLQGQLLWLGSSVGDNRFRSTGSNDNNLNKSSDSGEGWFNFLHVLIYTLEFQEVSFPFSDPSSRTRKMTNLITSIYQMQREFKSFRMR